ncbi:MAG: siroheme synthase [Gammaproteobacteria bacterium]|nr:siroheme synthase [Gammaproteobacteria bacterium]
MIPIALDPRCTRLAVVGTGERAARRLAALRAAGADEAQGFPDAPACEPLLSTLHALWIVDLAPDAARGLAERARAARVLVNVEDSPASCDFHSMAQVRRGDLLLTVSTAGAAPGLARVIRAHLGARFGEEWGERVALVRRLRDGWRDAGVAPSETARRIEALATERGWLA